jgi:hypothetical protein
MHVTQGIIAHGEWMVMTDGNSGSGSGRKKLEMRKQRAQDQLTSRT